MYVARARPCTQSVHGRERPCTRAVNKAVYRVPDRVGVPCTWPWTHLVHGPCTPVYTTRTRRERPCTRYVQITMPCTRAVKPAVFTVHGRVRAAYTAVIGSRTDHVRGPCMAVYTICTRPCTGYTYTAVFTARVHGGVRTVYMAVYTAVHGVYGSCTPACNGRVHRASTAIYRVHLHGRVL